MSGKRKRKSQPETEPTPQKRMETEHARHQRLMEHTGFLLEKALARAVEHLGKNTQEVKKITRYNGLTKVELGPVATLDQVLALFQAVRKLAVNQENTLKTLEPPRLIFHPSAELDEHDLEIIKNYTDKQLEAEIKKYLHG